MITLFSNILDLKNPNYRTVEYVYDRIRRNTDVVKVNQVRGAQDKGERSKLKAQLPCICFSGKFSERADDKLLEHSGRAVLDFDNVGVDLAEKRATMASYGFVEACFISPSGDGLKVVCRIPANIEKHRGYYRGLLKMFPDADSTGINESRVCYISHDKDIYVNMNAVEFTEYVDAPLSPVRQYAEVEYRNVETQYSKVDRAVKLIRESVDGEKHICLLKASKLMGGYIAGGLVDESEGVRILESEIQKKNIDDFSAAQKTIQKGIEYGKAQPIHELEQAYGVVNASGESITKMDEVWENMKHSFIHGKKRGATTHFDLFDANFKWKEGEITLVIGRPNFGKSEFILQLMLLKSVFCGWKWGIFSPENYPADEFFDSLIHTYIGKTTDPYFAGYQMTMQEYERGYDFVKRHFFYVYPESHTVEEIRNAFTYLVKSEGIKGTFTDPFNQLEIDFGARQDLFLSTYLRDCKRFAVKYNLCDVISTHPKGMQRNKSGIYDIPDIYDIWGGPMWGNKMDNIMVIDRPNFMTDPTNTAVDIHLKKVKKQRLVGVLGTCRFDFDRRTNRYYIDNVSPLDKIQPAQEAPPQRTEQQMNKSIYEKGRLAMTKAEKQEEMEQEVEIDDDEKVPF
jgi:twinkle protein